MYKSIKFTALFLFVAGVFVLTSFAQDKNTNSNLNNDGKIEVTFDKDKNETNVKLTEIPIMENESESLSMIAAGSFKGEKPTAPQSEILVILYASSKQRRYQVEPQLEVIADGETIRTRQMKNYGAKNKNDKVIEPLLTMMPFDVVTKISKAKKVIFKINNSEYDLTTKNLEAVKDFVSRLTP